MRRGPQARRPATHHQHQRQPEDQHAQALRIDNAAPEDRVLQRLDAIAQGLWKSGQLNLDGMITNRMKIDEINDAFDIMKKGEAIRTVITF